MHSEVGQNLAIDRDPCLRQTCDKPTVRKVVLTTSSIDALDPQAAEFALLRATVTESVLTRVQYLFVCGAEGTATFSLVSLRLFENRFVLFSCMYCAFYTCHVNILSNSFLS